jgi:predicted small integral membrane protein
VGRPAGATPAISGGMEMIVLQQLLKGVLALSVGIFGLLAALGNMLDYDTNWQFVRHVLSMDSMQSWFSGDSLCTRAITSPFWQQVAYIVIIIGEDLTGVLCFCGGLALLYGACRANPHSVTWGKKLFIAGCIPAVLVWYTGFAVIGGEYFFMWANHWNGQTKAYTFVSFILLSVIYITRPESE